MINLEDDEPDIVQRMLHFLYINYYVDTCAETVNGQLLINTKMYIIGDKYMVDKLKSLAIEKYRKALVSHWNSDAFSASLKLLYDNTTHDDRSLKDVCILLSQLLRESVALPG